MEKKLPIREKSISPFQHFQSVNKFLRETTGLPSKQLFRTIFCYLVFESRKKLQNRFSRKVFEFFYKLKIFVFIFLNSNCCDFFQNFSGRNWKLRTKHSTMPKQNENWNKFAENVVK